MIIKNKYTRYKLSVIHFKVKAGALQYAIFISVLIALLITALISLTYLQNHFKSKVSLFKDTVQNADLGISFSFENEIPYNEKIKIVTDENVNAIVNLKKSHWGIFNLIKTESKEKNEVFQKVALIGGVLNKDRIALNMSGLNRPLVVVGNTQIKGNAYLPKQGVKRGNISGHSYYGSQLIYGSIYQSKATLPKIQNLNYIKNIKQTIFENDSLEFVNLYDKQSIINSFFQPTKIYKQNYAIYLESIQITGNIIVQSDTLIHVDKSAILKDIVLIAPNIEIDDHVQGNFHTIASQKITLGENSILNYPSSLVLINQPSNSLIKTKINQIKLSSFSEIRGVVCSISKSNNNNNNNNNNNSPQIILEKNSLVVGEVYCDQNLELLGEVKGTVYTNGFISHQNGSVYLNHIYNGKINAKDIPNQFCGLEFEKSSNNTMQWLY